MIDVVIGFLSFFSIITFFIIVIGLIIFLEKDDRNIGLIFEDDCDN